MRRLHRLALVVGLTVAVGYILIVVAAFFLQRSMLFPVPAGAHQPKRAALLRLDGGVVAMEIPPQQGHPTLVFFHGNAEQLADTEWLGNQLAKSGVGFFAVEYPGYGLAGPVPEPSEDGCYAAAEAALIHLRKSTPGDRIVLVGQSLGTGVAVEMAQRGHGAGLVLLTPYTSIPAMASEAFPWLPARLLVRDRFDSVAKASTVRVPVLVIHGTKDEVVPVEMGRTMARAFPKSELMIVVGAHHNDVVDRAEVVERISAFARGPLVDAR